MELEVLPWVTILCYAFLYIAVLCLWIPYKIKIPLWSIFLGGASVCGFFSQQIEGYAIFIMMIIGYTLYEVERKELSLLRRIFAGVIALLVTYGLGAHLFSYFHNLKVLSNVYISTEGTPFTLYLNFDKTIVGLFILGLSERLLSTKQEWIQMGKETFLKAVLFILLLVSLAFLAGEVKFDPKLPDCWLIWLITNLLFVCMAEEAFFRGFIQKKLTVLLAKLAWGDGIAVLISALLFGFAHYAGGIAYSIWGTVAGIGYGWIYQQTKRIESSILTHFSLNVIHFLFFTYPAIR